MTSASLFPPAAPTAPTPSGAAPRPDAGDTRLAVGLGCFFLLTVALSGSHLLPLRPWAALAPVLLVWAAVVAVALLMSAALLWRRCHPGLMAGLLVVGGIGHLFVFAGPTVLILAAPLASYAAARWASLRFGYGLLGIGGAASVVASLAWQWPGGVFDFHRLASLDLGNSLLLAAFCFAVVLIAYLWGRSVRSGAQTAEAEALAALRAYQADVTSRQQAANLAQAHVRAEIARELHDVVAHSLAVMVVQAEGGQAAAAKNPAAATEALATIAHVGHEAMGEMRHIVGVLRDDSPSGQDIVYSPQTLDDIPAMVAQAGPRVSLTVAGQPPAVAPSVHLVAYRVVQESLTNVFKHAGPDANAQVHVEYLPNATIVITVSDDGLGTGAAAVFHDDGPGHGIQGMRERVASVGGRLAVGPVAGGGFQVQAWLPASGFPAAANTREEQP